MGKTKGPYTAEYKEQMISMYRAGNSARALAQEFGCSQESIKEWVKRADKDAGLPLVGKDILSSAEREELALLRRQVRQLKMERDILAKATAWFANKDAPASIASIG